MPPAAKRKAPGAKDPYRWMVRFKPPYGQIVLELSESKGLDVATWIRTVVFKDPEFTAEVEKLKGNKKR